jgi:hypothetical protein
MVGGHLRAQQQASDAYLSHSPKNQSAANAVVAASASEFQRAVWRASVCAWLHNIRIFVHHYIMPLCTQLTYPRDSNYQMFFVTCLSRYAQLLRINCIIITEILLFSLLFSGAVLQIAPAQSDFQ